MTEAESSEQNWRIWCHTSTSAWLQQRQKVAAKLLGDCNVQHSLSRKKMLKCLSICYSTD